MTGPPKRTHPRSGGHHKLAVADGAAVGGGEVLGGHIHRRHAGASQEVDACSTHEDTCGCARVCVVCACTVCVVCACAVCVCVAAACPTTTHRAASTNLASGARRRRPRRCESPAGGRGFRGTDKPCSAPGARRKQPVAGGAVLKSRPGAGAGAGSGWAAGGGAGGSCGATTRATSIPASGLLAACLHRYDGSSGSWLQA